MDTKRSMVLLLLLGLMLIGCQGSSTKETISSTTSATQIATAVDAVTPLPPLSVKQLVIATPTTTFTSIPTFTPSPSPTPIPSLSPKPTCTPFTIVWMSDTQIYSRIYPEVFLSISDWILNNREKENIQFVIHSGDVVDGLGPTMYENAARALVPIFEKLPGMIVCGNHDTAPNDYFYSFSHQPYALLVHEEGQTLSWNNGENVYASYVTFHAADTDFLVFGIGYNMVRINWMNEVIEKHPDHVVITVVHKGLQKTGAYTMETRPIFFEVMPQWPKFRLILCGHERGNLIRTDWFDDDHDDTPERSVTTMMYNYQDDWDAGLGFIRLLRFNPEDHSIEVSTYSPWYDQWGYSKVTDEENHFILTNAW